MPRPTAYTRGKVTAGMSPFSRLLRVYRRQAGLTQEELGRRAAIGQHTVSDAEVGRFTPRRHLVLALAAAMQLRARQRDRLIIAAGYAPDWLAAAVTHEQLIYRLWAEAREAEQAGVERPSLPVAPEPQCRQCKRRGRLRLGLCSLHYGRMYRVRKTGAA